MFIDNNCEIKSNVDLHNVDSPDHRLLFLRICHFMRIFFPSNAELTDKMGQLRSAVHSFETVWRLLQQFLHEIVLFALVDSVFFVPNFVVESYWFRMERALRQHFHIVAVVVHAT
jgi:hypothetical protein